MATRKTKATIPATPFVETIAPEAPEQKSYDFAAHMHRILDDALSAEQPSWKRLLLAWTLGLATSFGVGYLVGHLVMYATIGAALLTGSSFMALLTLVIGFILAIYLGGKASLYAYTKVMDKSIDKAYDSVKEFGANSYNSVRGMFTSSKGATA